MTDRRSARLILGGLVILFCLLSFTTWKLIVVGSRLDLSIESMEVGARMQSIAENVQRPSGTVVVITTTRLDGESVEDWGQRHQEAVDYWRSY